MKYNMLSYNPRMRKFLVWAKGIYSDNDRKRYYQMSFVQLVKSNNRNFVKNKKL